MQYFFVAMVEDPPFLLEIAKLSEKVEDEGNVTEMSQRNGTTTTMDEDFMGMGAEESQLDELREARIRAAQMEKTVQWWSECTANWREKWSTVKNERNKARDEIKALKAKLEAVNGQMCTLKRERGELSEGNAKLRKDVDRMEAELRRDRRAFVPPLRVLDGAPTRNAATENDLAMKTTTQTESLILEGDELLSKTSVHEEIKLLEVVHDSESENIEKKRQILEATLTSNLTQKLESSFELEDKKAVDTCEACAHVNQQLAVLQGQLNEAQKHISEEKSSKESLSDTVDELTADIEQLKGSIQEEKIAKDNAFDELNSIKEKTKKISKTHSETWAKNGEDRKIKDLRAEIERLQKENAVEWSKREKLETEKLAAARESKKLRHEVEDLTKELETKISETTRAASFDLKQVKKNLEETKKELADLKVSHFKLKKVYQDKKEDVLHSQTRAEQNEDEIKKLRSRVDELKRQLTVTEDEVDQKDGLARRLERSLEEQIQQCHVLQVQLEHLQSRWKQMTLTARIPRKENNNGTLSDDEHHFFESEDEF